MARMRDFEEAVGAAVTAGEIHGEMHLSIGQEAVAAVLARFVRPGDAVVSTHRPHLHALAAGVDPVPMVAEILERDGLNHGKGGHMHLFDDSVDFMTTGIVGAGAPIAAGYALARRRRADHAVAVAVTGDGAMNQGAVLETMNLAAALRLPLVFLCEDNEYSISVRKEVSTAGELSARGEAFGISGWSCSGADVDDIARSFDGAFRLARTGGRPALVVARVYRFRGHYEGDLDLYRPAAEREEALRSRDPLLVTRARLVAGGIPPGTLEATDRRAADDVARWFAAARRYPLPAVSSAGEGVFADD
jgi:TPP-dependent pyruvate/acetoin dehydrogenase alpha subunit